MNPERNIRTGAEKFQAPQAPEKEPKRGRLGSFVKRVGTAAGLGGALIAGESAMPKAQAADWKDLIIGGAREGTRAVETIGRHKEKMADIEARKEAQKEREETRRQEAAMETAKRGGLTGAEVETSGGKTTIKVTEGSTPRQREQEAQYTHEEVMAQMRANREREKGIHGQLQAAMARGDTNEVKRLTQEWIRLQEEKREAAQNRAEADSRKLEEARRAQTGQPAQPERK